MKKLFFTLLLAAATLPGWADEYYLVGGATECGWSGGEWNRSTVRATQTGTDTWVAAVRLTTGEDDNGRFKILNGTDEWDNNGIWALEQDAQLSSNEIGFSTTNDGDKKFRVAEEGMYLVSFNTNTKKIKADKLTEPSKDGDYFLISNLNDYWYFAAYIATNSTNTAKARLTNDLTFNNNFVCMASDKFRFKGEFDGGGHTIDYAVVNAAYGKIGLFTYLAGGAYIHDLIMGENCRFQGTVKTGGIAGYACDGGTVTLTNVINKAAAVSTSGSSGNEGNSAGFIACATDKTIITATNCANMGLVSGQDGQCAAFAGWTQSNEETGDDLVKTTFTNCWNSGVIYNTEGTAQLYRNSDKVTATNCYDASASTSRGQGTLLNTNAVASGELCYRLNGLSVTSLNWYQTLGTDNYPVPFSGHGEMALSQNEGWYEISEPWQLRWMAEAVNTKNDTYKSAQIKLINDIDYTAYTTQAAMLGAHLNPFRGTLDGQCHTVTVAFNNTAGEETALVRQLCEGTVKNLKVTGTITTNQKLAGGICSGIWQTGTITNCWSNVTINDNGTGNATHGGIVAHIKDNTNVTIANCLFSGHINAENRTGSGALVGWADNENDNVKINHCLVVGDIDLKSGSDNDLVCRRNATTSDNYYICDISNVNNNRGATDASSYENGKLCYLLNGSTSGGTNWTQTIGTDTYPIPFNTSMLVFQNGSDYDNIEKDGDWYKISNANELKLFSSKVNGGSTTLKARLTADITASSDFAPIGNNTNWYKSEFDGAYHTITLALNNTGVDYQGLFGTIADGAYIHDVTVAGSVKGRAYVAGVVAGVRGKSGEVNIFNCKNEATITGTGVNAAGIVGVNMNESNEGYCTTNISYCSNTGNVTGGSQSALISGWIGKGSITYSFASGEITGEDPNKEFTRYQICSFGENSTTTNVTMTGSASTGGAKYFNPADATYSIGDVETFLTIATMVNVGGLDTKNFTLTSDIDLTDKTFIPIGTASYRYKGTFDGGGNKVTLDIDNETEERQGLFGYATGGATFQNLIVDGTVNCGGNSAALIGEVGGPGQTGVITIRKVGCEATVTGHGNNVGAFIGNDWGATMRLQVENSYNIGDVSVTSGNNYSTVMGFWVSNTSTFTNVYNSGNLSGGSVFQFAVYNGNTGNDTYTNCYLSPTSDQLTSGELCYKLGAAFTQDLSQTSYPTFGSKQVILNGSYENVATALTLNDANSFGTNSDFDVTSVTMTRTLKGEKWNTFCVPFDMEISELGTGAEVKELTGATLNGENYNMTFSDASTIVAGKPYMVRVPNEVTSLNLGAKTIKGDITPATAGDVTFTGVYNNGKAPQGSFIISNNVFYNVDSDVTLKAFRGYITVDSGSSGVKALTFDFDDDATGISLMEDGRSQTEDGAIYNIAGQRINKMQRGINIVNGKKILK